MPARSNIQPCLDGNTESIYANRLFHRKTNDSRWVMQKLQSWYSYSCGYLQWLPERKSSWKKKRTKTHSTWAEEVEKWWVQAEEITKLNLLSAYYFLPSISTTRVNLWWAFDNEPEWINLWWAFDNEGEWICELRYSLASIFTWLVRVPSSTRTCFINEGEILEFLEPLALEFLAWS